MSLKVSEIRCSVRSFVAGMQEGPGRDALTSVHRSGPVEDRCGGVWTGGEQLGELADRGVRRGDGVSDRSGGDRRLRRGLQDLEAVERLQLSGLVRAPGWER